MSFVSKQTFLKNVFRLSGNRCSSSKLSTLADRFYNEEQKELQKTTIKLIETEINPYADQVFNLKLKINCKITK